MRKEPYLLARYYFISKKFYIYKVPSLFLGIIQKIKAFIIIQDLVSVTGVHVIYVRTTAAPCMQSTLMTRYSHIY